MTPEFAKSVDRIFIHVLGLLERISRNKVPVPTEERIQIRGWIDQAEAALGQTEDWTLAKYALVAWIDEVLIEAPWEGRAWWEANALEVEMFNTRDAYSEFFVKAVEATRLTRKNALEVYYVGAVLGFRGLYRDPTGMGLAEQLGLPLDLESWARDCARAIRLGQGRPPITEAGRPGRGAPPLEGKFTLVGVTLAGGILAAFTTVAIIGYLLATQSS